MKSERNEKELNKTFTKSKHVFVRSDLMTRIIKNSRGEKKRDEKKNMILEVNYDLNYTI